MEPTAIAEPAKAPNVDVSIAGELEDASASEALGWALQTFGPRLYIASSFQKTTSVTVHMVSELGLNARFFYLDTDVLFEETYETKRRLEERYGVTFERYSGMTLDEQAQLHGDALWSSDPDTCCNIRKVEPMREALGKVDCWVSGIRRQDSPLRSTAAKFGWDKRFGLWKLNHLAAWSEKDVWTYISRNEIPYNPLHDEGYTSIGCTHCTLKPSPNGDQRSGRWAGLDKQECGLHG